MGKQQTISSMIRNITLLVFTFFLETMAFAQNPCGTTIVFENPPQTLCSSLVRLDPIGAVPRGGVFSGPIVSANGMLSYAGMPAGTYTVYYTAPDTCGTLDSLDIQLEDIVSDATIFNAFDCSTTAGTELFLNAGQNESVYLQQGNDQLGFINQGRSEMLTVTSGARIDVIVTNNTGDCNGEIEIPTINEPSVQADLDFDCTQNRTFLNYVGPNNIENVVWQRYDQQPGDLPELFTSGTVSVPLSGIGNYSMRAIFDNGCENVATVNVPIAVSITPTASTGSRSLVDCTATATDSISLLGNSAGTTIGWSWSNADGTPFPSDSTVQRPRIPGIPATYVLRTINPLSNCFSEPDTAFITRSIPDTSDVSVTICEGETYTVNNDDFSFAGNYQSIETGTNGCDNLTNLELTVEPAPDVNFNITGPDSTGGYEIQIFSASSTALYDYAWCNGEIGTSIIVYQSQQCAVTITDSQTGCSTTEVISITTSSTQQVIPGNFTLAPNPVTDFVNWSYSGSATLLTTEVHSSMGQLIAKTSVPDAGNARIDLSNTPAGMYTITWTDSDGRRTSKRIVRQ
ncbi:MAG: T9SS type A sorting domain-containing protein [Saprospiraceae bacterium]